MRHRVGFGLQVGRVVVVGHAAHLVGLNITFEQTKSEGGYVLLLKIKNRSNAPIDVGQHLSLSLSLSEEAEGRLR